MPFVMEYVRQAFIEFRRFDIMLIITAIVSRDPEGEWVRVMDAKNAVRLIRRIRHDFGNHLQVLGGYADMGMPEKIKEYIQGIVEQMESERTVFNLDKPEAAMYFYWQMLRALDAGIALRYEDLEFKDGQIFMELDEPWRSLMMICGDMADKEEEPVVYLSIYEDGQGYDLLFSSELWGGEIKKARINR